MEEEILKQAVRYFIGKPGFLKFFEAMREKYQSLGYFGGTIVLKNLSLEEKEDLEGFFKKSFLKQGTVSLSVKRFEKCLLETKYQGCDTMKLVEAFLGHSLITNKDVRAEKKKKKALFFQELLQGYEKTKAGDWFLRVMETKQSPYQNFMKAYHVDEIAFSKRMRFVLDALNDLPVWKDEFLRIGSFAANVTGNPHFFDETRGAYSYLIYGIASLCGLSYGKGFCAEQRGEILYAGGLLKDDISNFVTCIGLVGSKKEGKGQGHRGILGFLQEREPVQLSLMNLSCIKALDAPNKIVYVFENPTVFADCIDVERSCLHEDFNLSAMVCSAGQPNLAVMILLDKLAAFGCCFYYSGDFDPEGLLIAQRLKQRYGNQLNFFHYEKEDYYFAKSEEEISERRIKQLERLEEPKLYALGELLKKERKAGYQEKLFQKIGYDINTI